MELTVFSSRSSRAGQHIRGLRDLDRAFCGFVLQFKRCGFADFDDDRVRQTIHYIRLDRGEFLDIVGSGVQFVHGHRTVAAGRNFLNFLRTIRILIDPELNACQRLAVVTDLLDLQRTERRSIDAKARGRHNLRGRGAQKDFLQGIVRRDVCRDIVQRSSIFTGCTDRERLARSAHGRGDRQLLGLVAGISGHGDAGGETRGIERIATVDIRQLDCGFAEVFEVARAAELVSAYTRNYMRKENVPRPVISSACPTIVRLIRLRFPYLCSHVMPMLPPLEVASRMYNAPGAEAPGRYTNR